MDIADLLKDKRGVLKYILQTLPSIGRFRLG